MNVLVKQIDRIARERVPLAVLLITNRSGALDPAVVRRASLRLRFARPGAAQRRMVLDRLLTGTRPSAEDLDVLTQASEPRAGVPFSFSDLTGRLARSALRRALRDGRPFGPAVLLSTLPDLKPSPLVETDVDHG